MRAGSSMRSDTVVEREECSGRRLDTLAARLCRAVLGRFDLHEVGVELWSGERIVLPGAVPVARLHFHSFGTLLRCLADPEMQIPDCYVDGELSIEGDLTALMHALLRASGDRASVRTRAAYHVSRLLARRTDASTSNVRHHYDLSNDFYRLWLDASMTYTCAYFPDRDASLETAQAAKLELVSRKLGLAPGQHVIEVGSGWGGLALHMARHHGVTVSAYNLSREQVEFARARAVREGLSRRVEFIEDDYRNLSGTCDAFVSVGMLEHVERGRYAELGGIIRRSMAPHGRALVHTIGRHRHVAPPRWTTARIFPGGYIPTLAEVAEIFEPNDLCVLDVENLRRHYAKTLEHWLDRFEAVRDDVASLFDERFVRTWRFYLASALAGFRSGWLQLFQVVVTGRANDRIPWHRRAPSEHG